MDDEKVTVFHRGDRVRVAHATDDFDREFLGRVGIVDADELVGLAGVSGQFVMVLFGHDQRKLVWPASLVKHVLPVVP